MGEVDDAEPALGVTPQDAKPSLRSRLWMDGRGRGPRAMIDGRSRCRPVALEGGIDQRGVGPKALQIFLPLWPLAQASAPLNLCGKEFMQQDRAPGFAPFPEVLLDPRAQAVLPGPLEPVADLIHVLDQCGRKAAEARFPTAHGTSSGCQRLR